MSEVEAKTNATANSPPANLMPPEIAAIGKQRMEALAAIQKELFDKFLEAHRSWIDRMQLQATLASEFASKMKEAHSAPEIAKVYQEWVARHVEMATEDAKHLFSDSQKFWETGARSLSGGWQPDGWGRRDAA